MQLLTEAQQNMDTRQHNSKNFKHLRELFKGKNFEFLGMPDNEMEQGPFDEGRLSDLVHVFKFAAIEDEGGNETLNLETVTEAVIAAAKEWNRIEQEEAEARRRS